MIDLMANLPSQESDRPYHLLTYLKFAYFSGSKLQIWGKYPVADYRSASVVEHETLTDRSPGPFMS